MNSARTRWLQLPLWNWGWWWDRIGHDVELVDIGDGREIALPFLGLNNDGVWQGQHMADAFRVALLLPSKLLKTPPKLYAHWDATQLASRK